MSKKFLGETMGKSKQEIKFDRRIEAQNKRIMGYVVNVFISMLTSILFTLLMFKAIGGK